MEYDVQTSARNGLLPNQVPSPRENGIATPSSNIISSKSISRPMSRDGQGTEIIYHNINYRIPMKLKGKKQERIVLKDASGIMKPGLNAILGPTGCGKTTLLDVLAGRADRSYLSGDVLVNGERQPRDFRLISGYVVQDDVVMGTLSVRENLYFSAVLRLGSQFKHDDRVARVEMIIQDLGLTACADSRVGTDEKRGISGGERKRTSIGMELITSPDVLFLDEPTTGLDATTACTVINLLRRQALRGRTIIFSIHQPRYSIFKLFDKITLLSEGEIIYNGPADKSMAYFEALGYTCEAYNNPADFYLDIISDEVKGKMVTEALTDGAVLTSSGREKAPSPGQKPLSATFREHEYFKEAQREIRPVIESLYHEEETGVRIRNGKIGYQSSFLKQLTYVSQRAARNLLRDPRALTTQLIVMVIYALLIGVIYFRLKRDSSGQQNRVGVLYFIAMNAIFSNMSAVALFIKERPVFMHEFSNGYYRVSTFFLSKVICDLLPMRVFPLVIFSAIGYFMVGLAEDVEKFWIFYTTVLLTSLAAAALCMFVSCCVSALAVANLLVSLPFVMMMIFSGLLVNLKSIPVWLRWLQYLSIFRYCLGTLEVNELENLTFGSGCGIYHNITCPTGNDYLHQQGFAANQIPTNLAALAAITVGFLLLCYVQLRRMKKYK